MIDGKPYKTLPRHLAAQCLTPETYRERYGLKAEYPMVAPNYSKRRAEVAKALGLRRKRAAPAAAAAAAAAADEALASEPTAAQDPAAKPKSKRPAKARAKADA